MKQRVARYSTDFVGKLVNACSKLNNILQILEYLEIDKRWTYQTIGIIRKKIPGNSSEENILLSQIYC